MSTRVAINGFGRIGRAVLRSAIERNADLDIVAVNDVADADALAHLLRLDSVYGRFMHPVHSEYGALVVAGRRIQVLAEHDPRALLPWGELGADVVIEATGRFRTRADAARHIQAGARKVILSAPAKGPESADANIVLGVNFDQVYDPDRHHIISNASCTTNCLVPTVKVVHDLAGIERGLMNTVHSYTTSQRLLDMAHKDPRRARAAAQNIVPTTSGATGSLGQVLPDLAGTFDGFALRVPTATVSVVDFTADVRRPTSVNEINEAFRAAEAGPMQAILGVSDEPLVSSDFRGDSRSAIVDSAMTMVSDGTLVKVIAWYDNEWGFSCRVADLIGLVAARLPVAATAARAWPHREALRWRSPRSASTRLPPSPTGIRVLVDRLWARGFSPA